jgi:hypothetical protein
LPVSSALRRAQGQIPGSLNVDASLKALTIRIGGPALLVVLATMLSSVSCSPGAAAERLRPPGRPSRLTQRPRPARRDLSVVPGTRVPCVSVNLTPNFRTFASPRTYAPRASP